MRALILGVATLALSAGAASAQGAYPNGSAEAVYPSYGYAPYGYGYVQGYGYRHRYHGYHHRYYAYYPRYHGYRGSYRY